MTSISGLSPINAMTTGSQQVMPISSPTRLEGMPLSAASIGAAEKPGILTRIRNAMVSAISELRGVSSLTNQAPQSLAMQAGSLPQSTAPVAVSKPRNSVAARFPNAKTWKDRQGNVREVGTGRIVKAAARSTSSATVNSGVAGQLPSNATQLQGATMYSFDQNGNPVAPTMQQLGMTPTMLQGLEGLSGGVDPAGSQMNATNQNNLGLGLGSTPTLGSSVPILGQPISSSLAQPSSGSGSSSSGGTQSVRNENVSDSSSNNQGFGLGWGDSGWGLPFGGVATPSAPYGASMLGTAAQRWF